jgi:hypothetical protein
MIAVNLNSKIINTATPISIAYLLGASDAEVGASCVPEQFFLGVDSIRKYCEGYLSVSRMPMAVAIAKYYGAGEGK